MKAIFLDFDGVLNGDDHPVFVEGWPYAHLDIPLVERLNRIIAATNAKVVVSSSWRVRFNLDELREILISRGFVGEVIDVTPRVPQRRFSEMISRGEEVQAWLHQHPDVESYVIIDDINEFKGMKKHFVETNHRTGITDKDVERAINILNGVNHPNIIL